MLISKNIVVAIFLVFFLKNAKSVKVCTTFPDYYLNASNCWDNQDSERNVTEIIRNWGFSAEEYYLTTSDAYQILVVRAYLNITKSTPVVIGHGIYSNSLIFVNMGSKSLAYILGTQGYDVWLINFRGTRYTQGNTNGLTVDDVAYWSYSFHQMGIYDLPKALQLVWDTTSQKSTYIGFSMGTTISYVYAILNQADSRAKLKGIISLAPVAHLNNTRTALRYASPFWPFVKPAAELIWKGQILPRNEAFARWCAQNPAEMYFCESLKVPIFGDDYDQMDPTTRPVQNILNPETIGENVVTHYSQIINSGKFQELDYGTAQNLLIYGSSTPPAYNVGNIKVPVSMYVGANDWLATTTDAQTLYNELTGVECGANAYTTVANPRFSHGDFVTAKDIKPLLNDLVASEVSKIEANSC